MATSEIQSEALSQAVLRSERTRIIGLLGATGALFLVVLLRTLLIDSGADLSLLNSMVVLGCLAGYEFFMLTTVSRAIQTGRDLSAAAWKLNLFVETLFPSLGLLILTESTVMGPYRALTAPAVPIYFFFIILSTLRLSPGLSLLTGAFSGAGYLVVVAYNYWQYPDPALRTFSVEIYLTYAAFIFIAGCLAAAVATQIRKHVAAALNEAKRVAGLEHDLDIARSIQQGLLPSQPPELSGFDIAGWNLPADETGGDYFDWQELPDGRWAITLADVTGHGIGPALVTAVCRAYARASFPADLDLESVMKRMNELLLEDLPAERFVTFVVAVLDRESTEICMLSAGHAPLLVYSAHEDQVHNYNAHGMPLGLMPAASYEPVQKINLSPGDLLILVTDGFLEWMNAQDEEFDLARLSAVIQEHKDLPASEIISRLYSAVLDFADGTEQQDDLTAVIIKKVEGN